jgi:hypothetical protein
MGTKYANLPVARVGLEFLETNRFVFVSHPFSSHFSTVHDFVFGAIAELVDNSHDAHATTCRIDMQQHYCNGSNVSSMSVIDNGDGMSRRLFLVCKFVSHVCRGGIHGYGIWLFVEKVRH